MRNVRPLPGPLPQERENHSPLFRAFNLLLHFAGSLPKNTVAAIATTTRELSGRVESLPLSPGERAGVRAGVAPDIFR
jgi:hypothetical protein